MHQQLKNGVSSTAAIAETLTFEEFLELGEDYKHAEWVDGKVVVMPPVSDGHARLNVYASHLILTFVEARELGEVRNEPFQMKTGPNFPSRSPDVFFVARKNTRRLKKTFLDGPADLVVEIISPGTRSIDRGDKYYEYERGGVREYWLLDPDRKQAEFYVLGRDRIYRSVVVGADEIYSSTVLKGFWMKVSWLWGQTRPTAAKLLKEWGIA